MGREENEGRRDKSQILLTSQVGSKSISNMWMNVTTNYSLRREIKFLKWQMPLFSFLLLRISQDSDSHAESQLMSVTSALGLDFGHLVLWSPVKDRPMARVFTGSRATVTEFSSWDEFPKSVCSVGHLTKQISLMFRGGCWHVILQFHFRAELKVNDQELIWLEFMFHVAPTGNRGSWVIRCGFWQDGLKTRLSEHVCSLSSPLGLLSGVGKWQILLSCPLYSELS